MNKPTIYWYDLETFGIDPKYHRIAQFAGLRTDESLNVIGKPLTLYCKPTNDFLPDPNSCLITGITPQFAAQNGEVEADFIGKINQEFSQPKTCVAGYNNIRFDDEFTRYCLYRNFYDPYAREWKNGNSRWDIIDIVRLTRALRPNGIVWPNHEDGSPSFKLEDITKANDIHHEAAHDALSDIYATIAVAKLIKSNQPKLYDYVYANRGKQALNTLLHANSAKSFIHVSAMYPVKHGCTALVYPLTVHPINKNGVIVYDLSKDPTALMSMSSEEIQNRIFTPSSALPDGIERIPLKTIHLNKCPIVVPANTLDDDSAERLGIDKQQCGKHLEQLKQESNLAGKIQKAFSESMKPTTNDPDFNLYGGFFSKADREKMDRIRTTPAKQLTGLDMIYDDFRIPEMLFRYRARNYFDTLNESEKLDWEQFRNERLNNPEIGVNWNQYIDQLDNFNIGKNMAHSNQQIILELQKYALSIKPVS